MRSRIASLFGRAIQIDIRGGFFACADLTQVSYRFGFVRRSLVRFSAVALKH
jgi:hypothetical protein